MFNSSISSSLNDNINYSSNHSMVPQLYGIKAVSHRVTINNDGVHIIQTRIPAALILFGFMVEALNVTLTKKKANYSDDCTDYWHSGAVLSERISKGIAKVSIELSEPGEYYVCFQENNNDDFNRTKITKQWLHQGSNYHVTLKVSDRLMPIPLQISLIILCLALSGTFSGLNLGLMSLDLNEIQVIIRCGTELEKQYAKIIAPIRKKGNYLLCSILFGNVLVNSTLTILMDDLTSGLVAVIVSTLSIVIFGEIVPQAICSRHGLAVGAKTIYLTKLFMLLTFPLSLFISKILDRVLGEEIGHVYDRERLMEYIKITKTYNQLEDDEMNIISGALCLKTKTAEDVMTRIEDAFMLPISSILDFNTVSEISKKGYSRIPVYDSERKNIIGLLHSKDLTFIDPDDKKPLKTIIEFYNHPLIYTEADERLNNVLNRFKNGKSHLAFVRKLFDTVDEDPYYEIIGLVTLEDVIEEILQMEIVDETDYLTDNRRKQRRKETQFRQDFSDFAKIGEGEIGTQAISPQMALATFQYLSTAIEPFQRKFITESILRRLIGQKIYYSAEMDQIEERTYLTTRSINSCRSNHNNTNEDDSKLLYKNGEPADYFIMILEGKVKVIVGSEKLTYEAGAFTYFGVSALKPPELALRMLLGVNNTIGDSNTELNTITTTANNQINQIQQQVVLNMCNRPTTPENIPLIDNHPLQTTCCTTRPSSPEFMPLIRSLSSNSELYAKTDFISQQQQQASAYNQLLETNSFIPDFTVKPIEKTLYMKIPRKVYLAAFRASLMDRKDEFLESDLALFKEEVDYIFYSDLANLENENKVIGNNQATTMLQNKNISSPDLVKDKKLPEIMPKFIPQQQQKQRTTSNITQISNTHLSAQIIQNPSTNAIIKQRRPSLINENNNNSKQHLKSPKSIRKFMKHQSENSSSNLSGTNLSANNANNNSYNTVNNNNITNASQLENVIVVDGGTKESKKTKF